MPSAPLLILAVPGAAIALPGWLSRTTLPAWPASSAGGVPGPLPIDSGPTALGLSCLDEVIGPFMPGWRCRGVLGSERLP